MSEVFVFRVPGIPKMFMTFFRIYSDAQTLPKMSEAIRKSYEYPEF